MFGVVPGTSGPIVPIRCYKRGGENALGEIPEAFIWHALIPLAMAFEYYHEGTGGYNSHWNSIYHRDISPANCFPKTGRKPGSYPSIVLADFGCYTFKDDNADHTTLPVPNGRYHRRHRIMAKQETCIKLVLLDTA
jgi:serine/threonine protein kinase